MSFKKLIPQLKETLKVLNIEEPTSFQKRVIPLIKGGNNVIGICEERKGKTTSIVINTIQKLGGAAYQDVPRALIFVKDKNAAISLEDEFKKFTRGSDLRIFSVYEEGAINFQKDQIYPGIDIVIATPKRLNKIYFQNGINLTGLQLLIVEDAEFLNGTSLHTEIHRITESLSKCQYLVFAKKLEGKVETLRDLFLSNASIIQG